MMAKCLIPARWTQTDARAATELKLKISSKAQTQAALSVSVYCMTLC